MQNPGAPAPVIQTRAVFPGAARMGPEANPAPIILVIGPEKSGKSATTITSCVNFPNPGMEPLVIAWDKTGSVSCLRLGYTAQALVVSEFAPAPGRGGNIPAQPRFWDRAQGVLAHLERNVQALKANHGALIVDCASTMMDRLHEDARRFSQNPDPRSHFGECLMQAKEFMNRIVDLGLPTIWLSWMKESETVEERGSAPGSPKKYKVIPGGPNIIGGFRALLGGKAHHIFILEKKKYGPVAGADPEGYVRVLHSQAYEGVNAGGRYSHLLPEPCPADLGWILSVITGRLVPR